MIRADITVRADGGTTQTILLSNHRVKRTGALITGTSGATITYSITNQAGTIVANGSLTHDDTNPGTWYANATLPDVNQTLELEVVSTIGSTTDKFSGRIYVET